MDCLSLPPSPSLDDSEEPQTPVRSPSRLDFCIGDLGEEPEDDSPTQGIDWSCAAFHDDFPYAFIDEDAPVANISLLEPPHPLIVEVGKDDAPQAHTHDNTNSPPVIFVPPELMDQAVIVPQSPIPVRPPSVQVQAEAQESLYHPRITAQRLNYPHHGFSRSALLQQKTFWNSRHDEWVEWQSHVGQADVRKQEPDTDYAYTGLAVAQPHALVSAPPYMRTPPSGLERDLASHPPRRHEQDFHASIYPRVGDISALRDPYSVDIDRSFFRLPLWTLQKTLYAFDMQRRTVSLSPFNAACQASMSSSTLSSYSSSTPGDEEESDSTLVSDDVPVPKSQLCLESLKSASHSPPSWNRFYGLEPSWYARWELLIGIFHRNHAKSDAFDISMKLEAPLQSMVATSSPLRRIFRFTVGEDEDDNEDDEDEDYGTPLADSSFSVDLDKECERALAFYNRGSQYSELTL